MLHTDLIIDIITLILLIVGLTATQYYNQLNEEKEFTDLKNTVTDQHNKLGKIIIDSMTKFSESKTNQHKELGNQILDLQNDIHRLLNES